MILLSNSHLVKYVSELMFAYKKRLRSSNFLNPVYVLNRDLHVSKELEAQKKSSEYPLEKILQKFPVENFSDQNAGVEIKLYLK